MRYQMKKLVFLVIIGVFLSSAALAQDTDVLEIIRHSNELMRGDKSYSELTMTVVTPKWTREYTMRCWTEGTEKAFILIVKPEKDDGTAFLKLGRQMWNYVPRGDAIIKIPPSMMLQSWMGSDFTNDDLARADSIVTDYDHKLLGSEEMNGAQCHKIESIPHEDAPVVWGKVLSWIDKDNYVAQKIEFYDEDNVLIKVLNTEEVKNIQGRAVPTKQVMTNEVKEGRSTSILISEIDFETKLPADIFDKNSIKLPR